MNGLHKVVSTMKALPIQKHNGVNRCS